MKSSSELLNRQKIKLRGEVLNRQKNEIRGINCLKNKKKTNKKTSLTITIFSVELNQMPMLDLFNSF